MKLICRIVVLVASFMLSISHAEIVHIDELNDALLRQLYNVAMKEAYTLGEILQDELFLEEHISQYLSASDYEALVSYTYENPATAVFFVANDMFDADSISSGYALPLSSVCFDFMYEVNNLYSTGKFAELSGRISIYGSTEIEDFENVSYVELVYSKNGPQIVIAFCEDDNGIILTKTSFVYNPIFIHNIVDDGNATFPFVLSQTWDEYFDKYIYKIRQGKE